MILPGIRWRPPHMKSDVGLVAVTGSCSAWSYCQAGEGEPEPRGQLLDRGLHARVAHPVVVVSSGMRACPLGVRGQQRVGVAPSTPPGPETTHERTEPTADLSSRP